MINNVWSKLTVHHAKPSISPISLYQRMAHEVGPVEYRVTFLNNSSLDITVVDRSGFRHTVHANYEIGEQKFTIRTEIRIRTDSIREVRKFLSTIDTRFNCDLTLIKQTMLENNGSYNGFTVFIDHAVGIDEIKQMGGSIYCKPKDLVISVGNIYNSSPHPYCEDSVSDYILHESLNDQKLGSPVFKIELVDNNNQVSSRFVFAFGNLHEVIPKTDINRESGVYLTMMEPNVLNDSGYSIVQKRYSFEEAREKLGLFKSREEAATAGDIQLIRKEELVRLEHANNLLKQESIELKASLDREATLRESELKKQQSEMQERIDKLKAERDEQEHFREQERAARKDEYDRRSTERKDYSEAIKFLPFVVMTIGALVAAFNKSAK